MSNTIERMTPAADVLGRELNAQVRQLEQELEAWRARMQALLGHVGVAAVCKGCGAQIYWVRHAGSTGRSAPYTPDGTNHFANCPNADQFRRQKGERVY